MINIKTQNPVIASLLTSSDLQPVQYALYCLLILNLRDSETLFPSIF